MYPIPFIAALSSDQIYNIFVQKNKLYSNNILMTSNEIRNLYGPKVKPQCEITSWFASPMNSQIPIDSSSVLYKRLRLGEQAGLVGITDMLIDSSHEVYDRVVIPFMLNVHIGAGLYKKSSPLQIKATLFIDCFSPAAPTAFLAKIPL